MSTINGNPLDRTATESDLLLWDVSKEAVQKRLAQLVQFFQVEHAQAGGRGVQALVDPLQLMSFAARSASSDDVSSDTISSMLMPITFYDGLPTVEGVPIWERLSGELVPYYNAFKVYRGLREATGRRSLAETAIKLDLPAKHLTLLSRIWHWAPRVAAYDIEVENQKQVQRLKKAEAIDGYLGVQAKNLIEMATAYLEENVERLNPKIAVELLKIMVPTLRISAGLPGAAPQEELKTGGGSAGGSSGISVNINNANGDNATAASVHGMSATEVMDKTKKQSENPTHLASILNILVQSGAMESTVLKDDTVDVDFKEVETDAEGTDY